MPDSETAIPLRLPRTITSERAHHILHGDATGGGHSPRTGKAGKSRFPSLWSDQTIIDMIADIACDPTLSHRPGRQGRRIVEGLRQGIQVRVIIDRDGQVITSFPL